MTITATELRAQATQYRALAAKCEEIAGMLDGGTAPVCAKPARAARAAKGEAQRSVLMLLANGKRMKAVDICTYLELNEQTFYAVTTRRHASWFKRERTVVRGVKTVVWMLSEEGQAEADSYVNHGDE